MGDHISIHGECAFPESWSAKRTTTTTTTDGIFLTSSFVTMEEVQFPEYGDNDIGKVKADFIDVPKCWCDSTSFALQVKLEMPNFGLCNERHRRGSRQTFHVFHDRLPRKFRSRQPFVFFSNRIVGTLTVLTFLSGVDSHRPTAPSHCPVDNTC